jgi:methylated-DNA-protein-cysteine methyltransferase-like protein
MKKDESSFKKDIYKIVESIPEGKVMTYGQIAVICGKPRAARIVGGVAHYGDPKLPWHRVVKKDGSLAEGYPGGVIGHQAALELEGIKFNSQGKIINMKTSSWLSEYKIV